MNLSRKAYLFTELVISRVGNVGMVVNYKATVREMQTSPKQRCPSLYPSRIASRCKTYCYGPITSPTIPSRNSNCIPRNNNSSQTFRETKIPTRQTFPRQEKRRLFETLNLPEQSLTAICEPLSSLGDAYAPKVFRTQHAIATGYLQLHYL
jgi:hypothetical protein